MTALWNNRSMSVPHIKARRPLVPLFNELPAFLILIWKSSLPWHAFETALMLICYMLNCTFPLQALTEVVNYCAINKCSQSGLDCFLYEVTVIALMTIKPFTLSLPCVDHLRGCLIWREEGREEGVTTHRWVYVQKFRSVWCPSRKGLTRNY